ncbi:MAG: hypothetical protein ACTJLM_05090 [Ehrlichia sp.]
MSFVSQITNVVCGALNIYNVVGGEVIKEGVECGIAKKNQSTIAVGFVDESVIFLGIPIVLFHFSGWCALCYRSCTSLCCPLVSLSSILKMYYIITK